MMTPIAVLNSLLSALKSSENALEKNQARAVLRALRVIYFWPDQMVKELDRIIASKGTDISPLIAIKDYLDRSETAINKEIQFITSDGITTNLSISSKTIGNLREAASAKRDVRANLFSMFLNHQIVGDDVAVLETAKSTKKLIVSLNNKIEQIESEMSSTKT